MSHASRTSGLSLGLVNDFGGELLEHEDDPRQTGGDTAVLSTAKWHKHTVKVYGMLKKNLSCDDGADGKPLSLNYGTMSKGVTRRTAAGFFFELLQLKTWDFIELEQDEAYGEIEVRVMGGV